MTPALPPVSKRRIGRYEITGRLAMGGMAEVLLGRFIGPHGFERAVVVKRILRDHVDAPGFWEMFVDEARIVATIHHPAVVQVYELGVDEGELFLAMEYLHGKSVSAVLRRLWETGKRMAPARAALVAAGACAGLHAAHELADAEGRPRRLVHRDVSPQNLFLTYDGHVKVLDFGIALVEGRATRTDAGRVKGKRAYMSPEQCLGRPLDRRSDIFSLGVVLYELCSTSRLFDRAEPHLVERAICDEPIPALRHARADTPEALERIVSRALERRPGDRYATAQDMRRDLLAFARGATDADPEEQLARLLQELFPGAGDVARKPPQLDTSHGDPAGVEPTTTLGAVSRADPEFAPAVGHRERTATRRVVSSRGRTLAVVGGLLVLASAGVYLAGRHDRSDPGLASSATPSIGSVSSIPPALPPPAPAAPKEVTVAVDTSPAGARVLVAGEERGVTPLRLGLPATGEVVPFELLLDRYEPYRLDVRTDVDQRVVLTLQPVPAAPLKSPALAPARGASLPPAASSPPASGASLPAAASAGPAPSPPPSSSAPGFVRFN
jgi:serine/threonine-protein kinase